MIIRVSDENFDKYNTFVNGHENGNFMQTVQWAKFKSNQRSFMIMSVDPAGEVRGTMLMLEHTVNRINKRFLYSPRGPVCSREDSVTLKELLDEASNIAKEIGAYKLTLDPDISDENKAWIEFFRENGAKIGDNSFDNGILQPISVYRIDVNKNDDDLIMSFHSKARYSVRSAIKSGAICRLGDKSDIPTFVSLLNKTAMKDGFTPRTEKYFFDLYDSLGEDMVKLFIVEYNNEAIAGSVLIKAANKTWHMYAGSDEKYNNLLPNFLMQWEMMRWSRDNGCFLYDMRGIAGEGNKLRPIEGLERFKKRFGGSLCSFVGRIDLIYNSFDDNIVRTVKKTSIIIKKLLGRK